MDPKGQILAQTEEKADIIYGELDFEEWQSIRESFPISTQKRYDIYDIIQK